MKSKATQTIEKLTAPGRVVVKPPRTDLSSREESKDDDYNSQKDDSDYNKKQSILEENATLFNDTEPTSAIDKCISRLKRERPDLIDPPYPCKPYISGGSGTEDSLKLYGTDVEEDSVDGFESDFYMNNVF